MLFRGQVIERSVNELEEIQKLRKRFIGLATMAEDQYRYVFTSFLSLPEQSVLHEMERDLSFTKIKLYGGYDDAERKVARFGSVNGYEEDFPISTIDLSPRNEKFAEQLDHRDFLGTLIGIGVDRSALGDILVYAKGSAYVFCRSSMQEFILHNLKRVRHTDMKCEIASAKDILPRGKVSQVHTFSSVRADCVASGVFNMSREKILKYFVSEKVFINGCLCTKPATQIKVGDAVTVRGKGRFTLVDILGQGRKGKFQCIIERDG